MVKNKELIGSPRCAEYDIQGINEIAKTAFYSVCVEEGCNIPEGEKFELEPDYDSVLVDYHMFDVMRQLVKDGMELYKSTNEIEG